MTKHERGEQLAALFHRAWDDLRARGELPSAGAVAETDFEQTALISMDREHVWEHLHATGLMSERACEAHAIFSAYQEATRSDNVVRRSEREAAAIDDLILPGRSTEHLVRLLRSGQPLHPEIASLLAARIEGSIVGSLTDWRFEKKYPKGKLSRPSGTGGSNRAAAAEAVSFYEDQRDRGATHAEALQATVEKAAMEESTVRKWIDCKPGSLLRAGERAIQRGRKESRTKLP